MKKKSWVTITVIIAVILLAILLMNLSSAIVTKADAQCIASNSELYTQLGCHACKIQEEMFGDNYQYLGAIDCFYDMDKCGGITHTPTWIINGEKIADVLTLKKLKELTGC